MTKKAPGSDNSSLFENKRWHTIFDAISDPIALLDENCFILQCNSAFASFLKKEPPELIGQKCFLLVHHTGYNIENCPFIRSQKSLKREEMELKMGERIFQVSIDPIRDEEGKFKGAVHILQDITEKKRFEDSLKLFKESVENSTDAIGMSTPEGEHYYQNKAFDELFGDIGKDPSTSVFVDKNAGREVFKVIMAGIEWIGEVEMYSKEHKILNILLRAFTIKNSEGRILGLVGVHTDITKRTQDKKQQLLATTILNLINQSRDIMQVIRSILSEIKKTSGVSAIGLRLLTAADAPYMYQLGFSDDFIRKENFICAYKPDGEILLDENHKPVLECTCGLVLSGKIPLGHPLFSPQGSFWSNNTLPLVNLPPEQDPRFHSRNYCIHSGYASLALIPLRGENEIIGLLQLNDFQPDRFTPESIKFYEELGASIGIALRNIRNEENLNAEKERLAVTLRSIGDGVITTDTQGKVMLMNRVAEELTGWTQHDAEGKPLSSVFCIVDILSHAPRPDPIGKVLASGATLELENNTLLISRDGTERAIADSVAPIKDRQSQTIGVVLVFRDITEKQKLIEAGQNNQRLESLGILAGGIAHDFNNLLTAIFGHIDLAISVTKEPETREYLDTTLQSVNRARDLTQQLLTFSKGGAPFKKPGDLFPFVQKTAQFALSGSNVLCNVTVEPDLWICNFDKNQIGQVIDNIVINAQQSMPMGGTIEITAKNITLKKNTKTILPSGDYVKISIQDSGIGIPKEIIPHIFDPFFTTKIKGHGLGLATCYSIISRHEGRIDVESEPGKGTAFHIYLPASGKACVNVPEIRPVTFFGKGRILVMDDEEMLRKLLYSMFTSVGYSVVCKENGKEVLDFFNEEVKANRSFSAMIFDLTIPGGMGGKEVIAEIRKLDTHTPVFVASGYASDPVMSNPQAYGFTASLQKPFIMADLFKMLNKYLNRPVS